MKYKLIITMLLILSLAGLSCTQKNFEIAPGTDDHQQTNASNQPHNFPNNSRPLFVEEFNFKTEKTQTVKRSDNTNNVLSPEQTSE
ncbi:hypothetical protein L3V86_07760 [Thiotrichales bacterium 19S11-10]|nr:hypothetical protein [Thiotrichales bacterium 19S11-10]MCF6807502.1 hypothetical protein [Thiotrichales bacterium 19S9-11]MCF6811471.1 hypothetical protein [Thiotrichales bacterium 19S9-12]